MLLFIELQVHENPKRSKVMGYLQVCFHVFLPPRFGEHLQMDMALDRKGDASGLYSPWRCTQITHYSFMVPCLSLHHALIKKHCTI